MLLFSLSRFLVQVRNIITIIIILIVIIVIIIIIIINYVWRPIS